MCCFANNWLFLVMPARIVSPLSMCHAVQLHIRVLNYMYVMYMYLLCTCTYYVHVPTMFMYVIFNVPTLCVCVYCSVVVTFNQEFPKAGHIILWLHLCVHFCVWFQSETVRPSNYTFFIVNLYLCVCTLYIFDGIHVI